MTPATAAISARREHCYGCRVSQERGCAGLGYASQEGINLSALSIAPDSPSRLLACTLPTLVQPTG